MFHWARPQPVAMGAKPMQGPGAVRSTSVNHCSLAPCHLYSAVGSAHVVSQCMMTWKCPVPPTFGGPHTASSQFAAPYIQLCGTVEYDTYTLSLPKPPPDASK